MRPADTLYTERLTLRKPRPGDGPAVFAGWTQDPEVCRYLGWTPHTKVEDSERFVSYVLGQWDEGTNFTWFACPRGSEAPIGSINVRPEGHSVNVGYLLAREHWGNGYATEALKAVLDWALSQPGIYRVEGVCHADHAASVWVMERAGMAREGKHARLCVFPNISDEPCDCWVFGKVR